MAPILWSSSDANGQTNDKEKPQGQCTTTDDAMVVDRIQAVGLMSEGAVRGPDSLPDVAAAAANEVILS